jgi:FdhD protein
VTTDQRVWRLTEDGLRPSEATMIVEEPLEIVVDGSHYAVVMRTPGDDAALAAGFCLAEGIIDGAGELGSIQTCEIENRNQVSVTRVGRRASTGPPRRAVPQTISSSCGICGREMIDDIAQRLPQIPEGPHTSLEELLELGRRLQEAQQYFRPTGATHAAALFDDGRDMIAFAEDIGRHSALDKAIGNLLLSDRLGEASAAVLSGRCSFEMVQKAARAAIPIVASVSAPTALAVELGRRAGLTLVGFLRDESLTVYLNAGRIRDLQ